MNSQKPSKSTVNALDWLNFVLADVQTGLGPFVAIYLAASKWNEEQVGLALTVGGIAGIVAQTPAGALTMALFPEFFPILAAQVLIGASSSLFSPAICAISLGIVGHSAFDACQGRNQMFNSAGNVVAALTMGLLGYYVSNRSIFFFVALLAIPAVLTLRWINLSEIDHQLARGYDQGENNKIWAVSGSFTGTSH